MRKKIKNQNIPHTTVSPSPPSPPPPLPPKAAAAAAPKPLLDEKIKCMYQFEMPSHYGHKKKRERGVEVKRKSPILIIDIIQ